MKTDTLDLRNMDCMELMSEYPDNHFDLAVVDPPYGIGNFIPDGQNKGDKWKRKKRDAVSWNDNTPNADYFEELHRVSKNQIIWGANYYNCFPLSGGAIIWDKKNNHPNMSKCEIASCSMHKKVEYYLEVVLKGFCSSEEQIHPCQKPLGLYNWIFANYAKKGMTILDTHLGSASSAVAAHYAGMHLTGSELDPDYFKAACDRVERDTRQATFL